MFPCKSCGSAEGFKLVDLSAADCKISDGAPCHACIELERLDIKIRETQAFLEQLAERRQVLTSDRNDYHDHLTQSFPPEIMSHIFTFCFLMAVESTSLDRDSMRVGVQVPLTLGAVCRTWKAIAWSTPQLWTSISVRLDDYGGHSYAQLIREWLGRSGQLPLSIHMFQPFDPKTWRMPSTEIRDTKLYSVIEAINEHSNRWQTLDVRLPRLLLERLHGNSSGDCILQELSISLLFERGFEGDVSFDMANVRPSPTKVEIGQLAYKSIHILWDKVTHVKMTDVNVDECLELFRQAQQMTHCDFHSMLPSGNDFPLPTKPIVHCSLQFLNIKPDWRGDAFNTFYDCISLPALQKLSVHTSPGDSRADAAASYTAVKSLLARSSCHLMELSIPWASFPEHEQGLISLLTESPYIMDLSISGGSHHPISDILFDHLRSPGAAPSSVETEVFLPHLRSLHLQGTRNFSWCLIPEIFPDGPVGISNDYCRPLSSFKLTLATSDCSDSDDYTQEVIDYVDQETVLRLTVLITNGVDLSIVDTSGRSLILPYSEV